MFDTHCHLNFDVFDTQLESVLKQAIKQGIDVFLVPGVDFKSSENAVKIAKNHKNCYAAVGIHPTGSLARLDIKKSIQKLEKLAKNDKVAAIGEIGLDYLKQDTPRDIQKIFFKEQIKLAIKLNLSLSIHNRRASSDIIETLESCWTKKLAGRVVFHCSPPDRKLIRFARERKIYLGIDGDVTYNESKRKLVEKLNLDEMVIETDSPFLTPEPVRRNNKFPNTPSNLKYVALNIAKIKNCSVKTVEKQTTINARGLFSIS